MKALVQKPSRVCHLPPTRIEQVGELHARVFSNHCCHPAHNVGSPVTVGIKLYSVWMWLALECKTEGEEWTRGSGCK